MFFPGHLCLLKDSLTAGMEYTQTKGSQLPPATVSWFYCSGSPVRCTDSK